MTERRVFILAHPEARRRALAYVAEAPDLYVVEVREQKRGLEQNAYLWVILQHFAEQLEWPVNGVMCKLSPEDWKDLLSAAYKRESQRVAIGIDGGMVMLGMRTSKMGRRTFAEFLEFVLSVAADRGVVIEREAVMA